MSQVMDTSLFVINETSLERILVNARAGKRTTVNATIMQNQLVWVYNARRLWGTYATALALALICGAVGLVCMLNNDDIRDLAFSDIVRATRNAELDSIFGGEIGADARNKVVLQYNTQKGDGTVSGGFVVLKSCKERSSFENMA
ncbi:uncharacterized protein EV420DRAFT_1573231 [Desarmillaria tabescens]|uniref:Uncharacterized protein n=1 Tax=Armillaria tabescens TaxID=1929756 RepID=A0AA39JPF1_ARMTA|nr:uncharacterized protein EV420DRAFT_1573231 [Desarmillaria tabescens]KAK0445059.1 hypothetical protein EV420DRAFT_1573231 [Desarmillaria tabescens]